MTSAHEPAYTRQHGPMEVPIRIVRLDDEIGNIKKEPAWIDGERAAKTLVKEGRLRVVLTLMHAATALQKHRTEGAATIQCIVGRIRLKARGRGIELLEGEIAALDGGVEHSVEAIRESAFLVTIAQ